MNEYSIHLAQLIKCRDEQDPGITHEWLLDSRAESVRLANFLRQHGYIVTHYKARVLSAELFYVGVDFKTLKRPD